MQICLLSDGYPPWNRGGAQRVAAQLARGYATRGHDVVVITTVPDREDTGRSVCDGIVIYRIWCPQVRSMLPYLTVYNPLVVGQCRRILKRIDPDVVHAHNVHYLSNGSLRAAASVAPVAKTFHDAGTVAYGDFTSFLGNDLSESAVPFDYRVSPLQQLREAGLRYFPPRNECNRHAAAHYVDTGVAVSRELRQALVANGIDCPEVIHNGVNADVIRSDADLEAFRATRDLGDDPFVLFGGRTSPEKGADHLARAFRRVVEEVSNARLLVTGDDEYAERMRAIIEPYDDRITTTGWLPRSELHSALAAATVVATPSVMFDPFPTLNLEAFAAGTPVVTSRYGGAKELVTHRGDGYIVDPTDVSTLADALHRFLDAPARAAACGAAGQRKVRTLFSLEAQVDAYLELLREVCDRSRDPGLVPTTE